MNSLVRAAIRLVPLTSAASPLRQSFSHTARPIARSLWHMCSSRENAALSNVGLSVPYPMCNCGCGSRQIHTKGERELIEFLSEEIATESKNRKVKTLPAEVEGFKIKTEGADVILSKSNGEEIIEVHFNVNHTVDTEAEADIDPTMDKPDFGELKSKPTFDVDIKRGTTTLSFTCSFFDSQQPASEEGYNDIFGIDEVALYEGEWKDNNYAVAGEVLDGCLYDLLMNLLDEKGISNDFVEKLSEFSTAYENHLYINMLQSIQKFTSGK